MSNATDSKRAKRSEPQPSAGEAPSSGHPEQSAQHTERQNPQKPRHAVDGTQTGADDAAPLCPEWCDPAQHFDDAEVDGTTTRYHRSMVEVQVPGWGEAQVVRKDAAGCAGVVTIALNPGGWADLESYTEAGEYQHAVGDAMHQLISIAWPQDRVSEIRDRAAAMSDEALPQYIELFQAEQARRAASSATVV